MSADRELLEMAAKAAGLVGEWDGDGSLIVAYVDHPLNIDGYYWRPLRDDGDALRLMVALDMDVGQGYEMAFANTTLVAAPDTEYDIESDTVIDRVRLPGERTETVHVEADEAYADHGGDRMAATRRAIVRAAADVGKAAP